MKTTYCGLLLLLIFAQWSVSAQQAPAQSAQSARLDNSLSAVYVTQSATALAAGDLKTVEGLLRVALEFDPKNSDAYYLQGEMYQKMGGKIPEAIKSYQSALDAANWSTYTDSECMLKLAPLLIRTKHYAQAADTLQGIGVSNAAYYLEYAHALAGMGNTFQASNLLQAAQNAYPSDANIAVFRAAIDPIFRAQLARRYLSASAVPSSDKAVLAGLVIDTTDTATKGRLIALYEKSFGFSPQVYAQSLMIATSVTPAQIDNYVTSGLLSDGALTEKLYAALPTGSAKSDLVGKIDAYTGTVNLDTNGDGIPEETATYRNGKLERLVVDPHQDGVPEYDISFSSGVPSSVKLMIDGSPYTLTYGTYPFVATASADTKGDQTTYTLDPERVSFSLFGGKPTVPAAPASFPPRVSAPDSITTHDLFSFAVQIATKNKSTQQPVSLWKKSINDILTMEKQWQSGRYNYRAVFHGGEKYSAEIDMDNDGYYEVHELYRNGKLYKVTYDGDHDGIPGFTLVLQPYPILSWDFNDDGVADEVEKRVNPTTTILEFSTKMNGVFDVVTKEAVKK